jgi:hypothetical protein
VPGGTYVVTWEGEGAVDFSMDVVQVGGGGGWGGGGRRLARLGRRLGRLRVAFGLGWESRRLPAPLGPQLPACACRPPALPHPGPTGAPCAPARPPSHRAHHPLTIHPSPTQARQIAAGRAEVDLKPSTGLNNGLFLTVRARAPPFPTPPPTPTPTPSSPPLWGGGAMGGRIAAGPHSSGARRPPRQAAPPPQRSTPPSFPACRSHPPPPPQTRPACPPASLPPRWSAPTP